VVDRVVAAGVVIGVRIGEEGLATSFFYLLDDLVDEEGLNIIGIAELAHVELNCDQISLRHAVERAGRLVEALCLASEVIRSIPGDQMNGHVIK
jgi:hypothetical protein